ncbi:MAG: prepilin-type N-terminal cleavage/methylation domain-containing protein [Oscillospiraceae bacterium]|nr:prepilin-type N-terminal cleavage/methylation domain-containing protein [Oscillospiraceae bacterium]
MKIRAFTLIECLIAMFILGISSLLLCQGYTQLMRLTNRTSTINTSIGQQMSDAELGFNADVGHSTQLIDKTKLTTENFKVTLIGRNTGLDPENASNKPKERDFDKKGEYKTKISVYEVKAYGAWHAGSTDPTQYDHDETKDGTEMRYIYFAG